MNEKTIKTLLNKCSSSNNCLAFTYSLSLESNGVLCFPSVYMFALRILIWAYELMLHISEF